jgi:hypothetical protein
MTPSISEIRLYHATQLGDFVTYLEQGGVLSREELESANSGYTRFFSDTKDRAANHWDRTFGNFADFGARFANFDGSVVPNAYGPICIVFAPGTIDALSDFQVTKVSVATEGYDLGAHHIALDQLSDYFDKTPSGVFPKKNSLGMEFSCADRMIGFDKVAYIIVDQISLNGRFLPDVVAEKVKGVGLGVRVFPRKLKKEGEKLTILSELLSWSIKLKGKLLDDNEELENSVPDSLTEWLKGLHPKGRGILASWLTYTYSGTLRYLND